MTPALAASTLMGLVTLGYAAACAIWPFTNCSRCGGDGRRPSPSGRAFRVCSRCHGSGGQLRVGRRLWTWWRRIHHRGTR